MNFMSEDSVFGQIFGFLGKLIMLNLLWMICSIPVITVGASTTALFYCTLKLHKDKDIRTFRDFFKSFKENFIQSTAVFFLIVLFAVLIYMENKIVTIMPENMADFFAYALAAISIPVILIALYIFPTIAAFKNNMITLITNAFCFAFKHIGYTLLVAVITILPMVMTLVDAKLFPIYLLIWLMFGFSLTAYVDSWFIWRLFRPYFPEETYICEEEMQTDQDIL